MKRTGKQLGYAVAGFIGCFIICYILIGEANTPIQRVSSMTRASAPTFSTSALVAPIHITLPSDQLAPAYSAYRENPFQKRPELRNVPAGTLPESYSVELIQRQ